MPTVLFDATIFHRIVCAWLGLGLATFIVLLFVTVPYGRHRRAGWGPALDPRAAWMMMEFPAVVVVAALFLGSGRTADLTAVVFFVMWEMHYGQRAFFYPLMLTARSARVPLLIPALGVVFNVFNGYLQGGWLFRVSVPYAAGWLRDPRFLFGATMFFGGMAINWHSDAVLRRLRRSGETAYKIPYGGLYRWVSCPNYLGEIVEWGGWALATWSLAAAAFAFWSAANLVPRALSHHRWYRENFPGYPSERGAILPYL